jgi:predicted HAD superfamily hydrolase
MTFPSDTEAHRFDALQSAIYASDDRFRLFNSDPDFRQGLTAELDRLLDGRSVLSLDVFDTLLLRDDSSELTRFVEFGQRIHDFLGSNAAVEREPAAVDIFLARYLGTKVSYRAGRRVQGCREGSLTEIYRTLIRLLDLPVTVDELVDLELECEAERLTPNGAIVDYARQHLDRGGKVLLLTDMYMHASQVRSLLGKLGIEADLTANLISSADTKVSKASGLLFAIAEESLGLPADEFLHVGDSLRGDFSQAIARGWKAFHLPIPRTAILRRREDHLRTEQWLSESHGVMTSVAIPG